MRNEHDIPRLLEDLRKHGFQNNKNVSINFGHVSHYQGSCPDISSLCMNNSEFSSFMVSAHKHAIDLGFQLTIYPRLMLGSCGAVSSRAFLIEPNGVVQNCWETVGQDDKKTGILSSDGIEITDNYIKWQGWDSLGSKECFDCNLLPTCMGGCPYRDIYKEHDSKEENGSCMPWKYNLKPMLTLMKQAKEKNLLAVRGSKNKDNDKKVKEKNVA